MSKEIKRNAPSHELLMADAARRDIQRNEAVTAKSHSETHAPKVKAADSYSQALIFGKLEKDFEEVLAQFSEDQALTHDEAKEAFINMGYCCWHFKKGEGFDITDDKKDNEAWNEIWKMMSHKAKQHAEEEALEKSSSDDENTEPTVSLQKLKVYMCVLQNLDMPWMQQVDESMTSQQIKSIFLSNLRMAQNRKDYVMVKRSEHKLSSNCQKNLHEPVHSFAPEINKSSKAAKASGGKRWEAIIEKGQEYKERKEELRLMKEEAKQQDPELTFKPKINAPKVKKGESMTQESEQSKAHVWEKLHGQAEKYWRMKFDRQHDAIEYVNEPHEYTFHPEILGDKRAGKHMPTFAQMRMGGAQGDQDGSFDENYEAMLNDQAANLTTQHLLADAEEPLADTMEQTVKAGADRNIQQEFGADEDEDEEDPASVCIDIALGN